MVVEYQLELQDADAFQRYHRAAHGGFIKVERGGWIWSIFLALVIAYAAVNLAIYLATWALNDLRQGKVPQVGVGVLIVTVVGIGLLVSWRKARSTWRKKLAQAWARQKFRLSVAPDGISFGSNETQAFVRWPGIVQIADTPTHAFFYTDEFSAQILPARAFASEVEFRTFVGLA